MAEERRVRDIGEFGLIEALRRALPAEALTSASLEIGIGDDAAVWSPAAGEKIVLTTDSLVEGVHFRLDWTDWESLGHKTLAVNVSDLAAMGAVPRIALVTLGLRGDEPLRDLEALYAGMGALARRHGMIIAGGDIVRSPQALTFHVTALGETRGGRVLTRGGARPGDIIAVSGTLGAAPAGLRLLALDVTDPARRAATAERLITAHLRPEPRVALGGILLDHGTSAALDLSDGLLGDLPKILHESGVSARIDPTRIPVAAAVRALFPDAWREMAMRGGEDYELLFTVSPERWFALEKAAIERGISVTAIGEVVARTGGDASIETIGPDGDSQNLIPGAFDHFAGR
jgi:thiamine-monophosphate kinase